MVHSLQVSWLRPNAQCLGLIQNWEVSGDSWFIRTVGRELIPLVLRQLQRFKGYSRLDRSWSLSQGKSHLSSNSSSHSERETVNLTCRKRKFPRTKVTACTKLMQRGNVQCTTDIEEVLVLADGKKQTAAKHELQQIVTKMSEQWTPKLDKRFTLKPRTYIQLKQSLPILGFQTSHYFCYCKVARIWSADIDYLRDYWELPGEVRLEHYLGCMQESLSIVPRTASIISKC